VAASRTLTILNTVHRLLSEGTTATKRDVYYMHANAFSSSFNCDRSILDVAALLNVTRRSLNITTSPRGLYLSGTIQFSAGNDEHTVVCRPQPITNDLAFSASGFDRARCASGARFVLVVEKEAVFARLTEEQFTRRYPSVLITGKGYPDLATRAFVSRVCRHAELPVYGLFDWNPSGVSLALCYKIGSATFCLEGSKYACPGLRWIGVRHRHIPKALLKDVSASTLSTLSQKEMSLARSMLERPFFKAPRNRAWASEIEHMIRVGRKVDIETIYPTMSSNATKSDDTCSDFSSLVYREICRGDALE